MGDSLDANALQVATSGAVDTYAHVHGGSCAELAAGNQGGAYHTIKVKGVDLKVWCDFSVVQDQECCQAHQPLQRGPKHLDRMSQAWSHNASVERRGCALPYKVWAKALVKLTLITARCVST